MHTQLVPKCPIVADIGILVDSSGSLGSEFYKEKAFIKSLAKELTISSDGVNIGVVTFSYWARLTIKLSQYKDTQSFIEAADRIPFMNSQTYIDRALIWARNYLFTEANGDRKDAPNILILLTDGKQTQSRWATSPVEKAELLRRDGVTIFSVGIGQGVDEVQLASIAGKLENLFLATSFDNLLSGPFLKQLLSKTCASAAGKRSFCFILSM